MRLCEILSVPPRRSARRLPRPLAFKAQGVALKFPARSWSGIRCDDGAVVIAIREGDVQLGDEGCSCLLWAPLAEGAAPWVDRPIRQERLEHCRLAVLHGGADGLILRGAGAEADPYELLALHVEKLGGEYWARWGAAARSMPVPPFAEAQAERLHEARIAA
ncbi:MAG TPA: hypothetical protein VML57_01500 [Burkholderiales bacterium]|nr:hypothetical protein [Burkholderiales bacterium]